MTTTMTREPVTVEHRNELPGDGRNCEVISGKFRRFFGRIVTIVKPHPCLQQASTFVTLTCLKHDTTHRAVCSKHLKQLIDGKLVVCCFICKKSALWREERF